MNEKTWLDYLVVAGTIATPILVLLLSGIGWRLRNRLEREVDPILWTGFRHS